MAAAFSEYNSECVKFSLTTLIFLLDLEVLDMRDEEDSLDTTVTSRYCTVLYCTVLYCTL